MAGEPRKSKASLLRSSSLSKPPDPQTLPDQLQSIAEDEEVVALEKKKTRAVEVDMTNMTPAQVKRATMVKKCIKYFEDKSNRSVSEDNLFTRRKNLAVHLGLDETVGIKEVQKINTYCLPVPSSATSFDAEAPVVPKDVPQAVDTQMLERLKLQDDFEEDDTKTKNLVRFLGMKDGISASIASQGNTVGRILFKHTPAPVTNRQIFIPDIT